MEFLNKLKEVVIDKIDNGEAHELVFVILMFLAAVPLIAMILSIFAAITFEFSFILGLMHLTVYAVCFLAIVYIAYKWVMQKIN